jgi:hypothetical protein
VGLSTSPPTWTAAKAASTFLYFWRCAINALDLVNYVLRHTDYPAELSEIAEDTMGVRALDCVNQAIEEIFNANHRWRWRRTINTLSLTASQEATDLPATVDPDTIEDVLRTSDNQSLTFYEVWEWQQQKKGRGSSSGDPEIYTIVNDQILVFPTPSSGKSVSFYAQTLPEVLASTADTTTIPSKWHFSALAPAALYYMKLFLGDPDIGAQERIKQRGLQAMLTHNERYSGRQGGMKISEPNRLDYEGR